MSTAAHEIGRHVVLDVVRTDANIEMLRAYDRERRHEVMLVLRDESALELRALAKLSHPNVAEIYEVGLHEGRSFVAMEAVGGPTLAEWSVRPRAWREVLAIVVAAGDGLAAAHAVGVVHGSFSATSVILEKTGRVCVTGFGTHAASKPDDLEAFAAVAWAAIYGKPPFAHAAERELARVDEQRAPTWVYTALARVLKAAPEARGDMATLLGELRRDAVRTKHLRVAGVALAIGATIGGVVGVRSWIERARITACEEEGALIDTVWNDVARGDVETAIAHSGAADPRAIAARATATLDDFAAQWARARTGVCIGRELDLDVDPATFAGTMSCLETRHLALEALLAELARPDAVTAARAPEAAAMLPSPIDCRSPGHHGAPHPDGVAIEPARAIRASLARVRVMLTLGKVSAARELATTTVDEALALGWRPLVADARVQMCAALAADGAAEQARAVCEAAYFDAALDRRADPMTDAAIVLVEIADDLGREDEARHWAMHAETALELAQDADDRRALRLRATEAAAKHSRPSSE